MKHQRVGDVMSEAVVRVQRGTPFKEIAHLLQDYDITAVPVVDADDRPVGVVSEADLLQKMWGGEPDEVPGDGEEPWAAGAKRAATDAGGLMTSPAVCAHEDWSVVQAARVMARRNIKRLLVVDEEGRLMGVVSRSDLLRVFLRKDRAIRTEIIEEALVRTLGLAPSSIQVDVTHGHVVLSGGLPRDVSVAVLEESCGRVDGVVAVEFRAAGETESDAAASD